MEEVLKELLEVMKKHEITFVRTADEKSLAICFYINKKPIDINFIEEINIWDLEQYIVDLKKRNK